MSLYLTEDLQENYRVFIDRVRVNGSVWGLKSGDDWAVCPSVEYECDVYPVWSDEAYAWQLCTEAWADYEPAPIPLEEFLEDWIPGLEQDEHLVGVQFTPGMVGLEVEPLRLAADLTEGA